MGKTKYEKVMEELLQAIMPVINKHKLILNLKTRQIYPDDGESIGTLPDEICWGKDVFLPSSEKYNFCENAQKLMKQEIMGF